MNIRFSTSFENYQIIDRPASFGEPPAYERFESENNRQP